MVKREKTQFVSELSESDAIDDIFVVKKKLNVTQYKKGFRFTLILGDKTGEIEYKYWGSKDKEKVEKVYEKFSENEVIYVTGKVSKWRNKLEISANQDDIITLVPREEYYLKDFIEVSKNDLDDLFSEVESFFDLVENKELKKLLESVFGDNVISSEFMKSPLTVYNHYNWVGGLMEHTINVTKLCNLLLKLHPSLDKDLLITASLLHDIGKIKSYEISTSVKQSKRNMLLGHVIMGVQIVTEKAKEVELPNSLTDKIIHMISTHHGKLEKNYLYKPSTPEAVALMYANDLDSKTKMISKKREESSESSAKFSELGTFLLD